MKQFSVRFGKLIFGLFLYALGIVTTIKANIGYAPWDAFHAGLSKTFGINIGTASILVGLIIVVIAILLGERLGLGTLLNIVLIGVFIDLLLLLDIIPKTDNFALGIIMLIVGLYIIAIASYFYISSAFGAGPRDSLMVALTRKTGLSVGICRGSIELIVALIGWRLGGMIGIGTILSALIMGFCIQTTFKLFRFDVTKVNHDTLDQTFIKLFKNKSEA